MNSERGLLLNSLLAISLPLALFVKVNNKLERSQVSDTSFTAQTTG